MYLFLVYYDYMIHTFHILWSGLPHPHKYWSYTNYDTEQDRRGTLIWFKSKARANLNFLYLTILLKLVVKRIDR